MIVCTVCGRPNEEGAQFCGSCGRFLGWTGQAGDGTSEGTAAPAKPEVQPAPGTPSAGDRSDVGEAAAGNQVACASCGTLNDPDRVFCRRCAKELRPARPLPTSDAPKPRRPPGLPIPMPLLAGVGIVALAAIAGIAVLPNLLSGGGGSTAGPSPTAGPTETPVAVTQPPSSTEAGAPSGRIAFTSTVEGNADIVVAAPDGTGLARLVEGPGNQVQPAWSRTGTRLAFASDDGIWIVKTDGTDPVRLTRDGQDRKPEWSPDDSVIAYAGRSDGDFEIYLTQVSEGTTVKLTDNAVDDHDPSWSAVNDRIAFVSARSGTRSIWTMRSNGTDAVRLAGDEGEEEDPAWSPDARTIAFASSREGTFFIYLMDSDGSNIRRLASGTAVEHDPTWSADGRFVAFTRAGEPSVIVVVDAATGAEIATLGEPAGDAGWSAWH